jgi:hypothetical protein
MSIAKPCPRCGACLLSRSNTSTLLKIRRYVVKPSLFEDEIIPPLKDAMLRAAVPVSLVSPLSTLPDPSQMIPRCAFAMEALAGSIDEEINLVEKAMNTDEKPHRKLVLASTAGMLKRRLRHRATTSVKRLAVFHDGGQSPWLDDHDDAPALKHMLERLALPASQPFERPSVVVPEVVEPLCWGLSGDDDDDQPALDIDHLVGRLRETSAAIAGWASYLRALEGASENLPELR